MPFGVPSSAGAELAASPGSYKLAGDTEFPGSFSTFGRHLGQTSFSVKSPRNLTQDHSLIGWSTVFLQTSHSALNTRSHATPPRMPHTTGTHHSQPA